jgi:endogenous inhibitor of DNA gyrase (YacG/DUF329 family)
MSQPVLRVNCPTCKEIVEWGEQSPWRPFCCERCKLIDFGEWANERHSILGDPVDPEQLASMTHRSDEHD